MESRIVVVVAVVVLVDIRQIGVVMDRGGRRNLLQFPSEIRIPSSGIGIIESTRSGLVEVGVGIPQGWR